MPSPNPWALIGTPLRGTRAEGFQVGASKRLKGARVTVNVRCAPKATANAYGSDL